MRRDSKHAEWPPYSYVPGKFPHPTRDPQGHWFGREEKEAAPLASENWLSNDDYLFGIELFNRGYYWESHECWEAVWHACGRHGAYADFLKALIKLAAAGVKAREGRTAGVARHGRRAVELLDTVKVAMPDDDETVCGLSIESLQHYARMIVDSPEQFVDTCDDPVVVVFPFEMELATGA